MWPDSRTKWFEEDRTVEFTPVGGEAIRLSLGDHVLVGGSGDGVTEGVEWANLPCALGPNALVSNIEVME